MEIWQSTDKNKCKPTLHFITLCDAYIFVYIPLVMACILSCLNKRIWWWWWRWWWLPAASSSLVWTVHTSPLWLYTAYTTQNRTVPTVFLPVLATQLSCCPPDRRATSRKWAEENRLPVSAATFPTISTSVEFSYGSISMIPLRMVSVTFAPAAHSNNKLSGHLYSVYSNDPSTNARQEQPLQQQVTEYKINLQNGPVVLATSHLWQPGVVVSALALINEVNQRRARLVLRWVTISVFDSRCRDIYLCMWPVTEVNSAWPSLSGQGQWVPAKGRWCLAAGEKAGMVRVWVAGKTVIPLVLSIIRHYRYTNNQITLTLTALDSTPLASNASKHLIQDSDWKAPMTWCSDIPQIGPCLTHCQYSNTICCTTIADCS